jgi:hypothetical protein
MTYRFIDRLLGHTSDVQAGDLVLGRFMVEPLGDDSTFLNSVAIAQPSFCVPDLRGHWQLMEPGRERVEGTMSRAQVLDRLDVTSILDVGNSVRGVLSSGGTWLDALDVSPLVPGMSERAELQEFEKLLADRLGHLVEVCQRPRTHLRVEVERTDVTRARRLATQASSYLAAHTEDWDRPTLRAVIPKRILSLVREDQFDIYENRVAVRLVDHLDAYLSRRVTEVSRLLRLFNEVGDHSSTAGQGSHWRQKRVYQLWGDSLDAGEARRKAERTLEQLKFLKYSVSGLMDSVLYREVPRRAFVSTTLTMTNIPINGRGIDGLRIVPLCSSIAALDSEHLRHLVNDADRGASDSDIVVLYPTPPTSEVYKRLDRELARRLHALSHEVASAGRRRVGFLPVSPWDIGSVERVARQVRWITMTPKFRGYPPTIKRPSGLDLRRASAWLKPSADSICVLRTPREHEQLPVAQEVEAAISRVAELEIEHKLVSRNLQDVHRQGAATGGLNSRKKALNAEITAAETQLKELQGFRAELSDAIASVEDLLRCPTCENRADPSHDFASDAGHRFSCACPGCGTKWDNRRCTQCQAWIPTLLPSSSSWEGHVRELGWIDRTLGADVLATPVVVGTEIAYICPSCGAGPEATDNP